MTLDANALSRLKVKDLQGELKKRHLDTSGLKATLLQRLQEHLQQEEAPETQKEEEETQVTTKEEKQTIKKSQENEEEEQPEAKDETKDADKSGNDDDKNEMAVGLKRRGEAGTEEEERRDGKKPKVSESSSLQPEDSGKQMSSGDDAEVEGETTTAAGTKSTIRIDNFVRPFTLNAVKTLVQEFGCFVEEGFWMDAIKTHCFVTYSSSEIAEKTCSALNGRVWPPENGRSLCVKLVDYTAMEVSQYGEANIPSRLKSKTSSATQRPKVTIDDFFQKTTTKPVLYYLPLTDEQIKQRKEGPGPQPEKQPRKRRHRGGRKRNRRARFQRR